MEPAYSRPQAVLAATLAEMGLKNVAWAGFAGQSYYDSARIYSQRLARLSKLAQTEMDLVHLAGGWKRIQAQWEMQSADIGSKSIANELIVVVDALPPQLLGVLEKFERQGIQLLLILIDTRRHYVSGPKQTYRRGIGWPGPYAEARGLTYPDPQEVSTPDKLGRSIIDLLNVPGVKVLHLLGSVSALETDHPSKSSSTEIAASPSLTPWDEAQPCEPDSDYSFASLALNRITADLMDLGEVTCLWARSASPGPLSALRSRCQRCSLDGLILQAVGMAATGCHPLVAVSANSLPRLLPDLLEITPFPITFLLMDAGLSPSIPDSAPSPSRIRDLALLRTVPDMTLAVPADEEEARGMLRALLCLPSPGALRLTCAPAVGTPANEARPILEPGRGRQLRPGNDISLVGVGSSVYHAMLAAETINALGFQAGVYDFRYVEPLDYDLLRQAASTGKIITIEEHATTGGLGTAVLEALSRPDFLGGLPSPNTGAPGDEARQHVKTSIIGLSPTLNSNDPEDHGICQAGIVKRAKMLLNIPELQSRSLGPLG